ncbi:chromosome segregation protein SMC [Streptococcus sp. zg-JUN1979]|uniref:chromosome segregation protein SMC n=1 Tax=Streptococcus sp. zg-JUN1979 TaxID=3391450 RepID=UPI0039A47771
MFLKEIEMQGFKSFADKTVISFDKGVTAVVGPNGSGKSNITESLRWALGESSAKSLRGAKMPDVIFAGTQNRKPLNYAYVAVTFDNSDAFIDNKGESVRVERRIFRNGDSDYLIDTQKVRLRDVHDLFMDTGLGRDSFSIISQGRVEEIFNSKAQDRRAIFEEAAGVLKYKTRKKETQSKLGQTKDNLDRLEDIIYELEAQQKPLQKQAEIAERFLEMDGERQVLDLSLLVADIVSDKTALAEKEEELSELNQKLERYYVNRQALESKNQKLKAKRQALRQTSGEQQAQLVSVTGLVSDLQGQIDLAHLEVSQSSQQKEQLQEQLDKHEDMLADETRDKEQKSKHLIRLESQLKEKQQRIRLLKKELEHYSSDPDRLIEELREQFVGLMQKEADLSNRLTSLKAQQNQQEEITKTHQNEVKQLSLDLAELERDSGALADGYQQSQKAVSDLVSTYRTQEDSFQELRANYQESQQALFDIMDKLTSKKARYGSLEAIMANHSHFYAGVKAVLQAQDRLEGIIGAVSEHLSFSSEYQTALEIALGASSQHIIVADEAAAKSAIAFLKKGRHGRATFLPLTTIKERFLSQQQMSLLAECAGFQGLASQLVEVDDKLNVIMANLLGVTAIFDTVEHANQAAKRLAYKVRMVTLDGTEIRPGGSFSGGASRQNNTIFIKPELDQLALEIEALTKEQLTSEKAVERLKQELDLKEADLLALKSQGEKARLKEQAAQLAHQQALSRLEDMRATYDARRHHLVDKELDQLLDETKSLEQDLQAIEKQKETLSQQIDSIKSDKDSVLKKQTELTRQVSDLQLSERDDASELKFERENLKRLDQQLEQRQSEIAHLKTRLSQEKTQSLKDKLPVLNQQLADAKETKDSLERQQIQLGFELEDYEAQLEELEEAMINEQQTNETLIAQKATCQASFDQISQRLRHFARRISEDYQLSLDEAKQKAAVLDNPELAREQLAQLERGIKGLGPVNVDAISQFAELNQRLGFLNGQKADLLAAKDLLLGTISDMDEEVKQRFKETFEAIRESFKETFKSMFGGGSADLVLTSDDLLEAGIEISVQPPGKKIQSLNLMSGGEKALSALALLFAIIRVKTVPFVILDEVEAALDEANVKRFGDYLNRFDKSSQFIVVTHRKGTMEAADSIYGVTMQESGVSTIVSVKLKEATELTRQ